MDGILVLVLYGVGRAEFWEFCIIRMNIILNIIRIKYHGTLEQAAGLRDIVGPTHSGAVHRVWENNFPEI